MLLTEIEAAKQIRDGQLPSPYQFSNMWLVNLRITGTGMAYRAEEKEFVWRSPQTYLNPQFLERCAGVPVIIDHPEGKTIEDVGERSRIIGTVMLPYIRGDEVWGVCRIYGQEIIDYIQKARGEVSTSPSVVFCGASGGAEVPDVMGEDNFFIEGTPFLIDHVALVPLGVWDMGVAGPFGFGMMSRSVVEKQKNADELVATPGELKAAESTYSPYFSGVGNVLNTLAAAQNDISHPARVGLLNLGLNPDKNATENLPVFLKKVAELAKEYQG
ncbi:DUF2213 domain-containing protein, partial [Escherichia coli]